MTVKYEYLTETVDLGLSNSNFKKKIDSLISQRAIEGWKLAKMEMAELVGVCIVVFEREKDFNF